VLGIDKQLFSSNTVGYAKAGLQHGMDSLWTDWRWNGGIDSIGDVAKTLVPV